ncbi:hypothetical protein WKI65_08155 [Streptomyces sp. MS1.AVA.3]|uniref:MmyB family transcriptional regulator n=1 Tax=Streptomyces decoyicus TaxID=249567 RepID=UPI0030BB7766
MQPPGQPPPTAPRSARPPETPTPTRTEEIRADQDAARNPPGRRPDGHHGGVRTECPCAASPARNVRRGPGSSRPLAQLRSPYGRHVGEPAWESLIGRLSRVSADFARLWEAGGVSPPGNRMKVIQHASVGEIRPGASAAACLPGPHGSGAERGAQRRRAHGAPTTTPAGQRFRITQRSRLRLEAGSSGLWS